ncbi:MAG: hypothetical protein K940chlam9_01521 [Chlamydiae bacterium]|nr:hypothetical protein [Chlamydiota bacterium]
MKSYHLTLWGVLLFFFGVMAFVVTLAFLRESNATGHDPAQIAHLRREGERK